MRRLLRFTAGTFVDRTSDFRDRNDFLIPFMLQVVGLVRGRYLLPRDATRLLQEAMQLGAGE
jgi:hypothetical protein